jgi:hypothetical protein
VPGINPLSSLKKGDGQRNRRLPTFSFRFLDRTNGKSTKCAWNCAQPSVPINAVKSDEQPTPLVVLSGKGAGLEGSRSWCLAVENVRVSACVTYTSRRAVRWPSGRRRRFAKPVSRRSAFRESRLNSRVQAENVPIPILSRRVPISRFPTRLLHNLLHTCSVEHGYGVRKRPRRARLGGYSRP